MSPAGPPVVEVVEDEAGARIGLTDLLQRRGYTVISAKNGEQAVVEAKRAGANVILMDIKLGSEGIDGIEAAQEIQRSIPLTSFIFTTAYADDPGYQRRLRESQIRVGGCLGKPIDISDLPRLIDKEHQKLQVLALISEARQRGHDAVAYLHALAEVRSLPHEIVEELEKELVAGPNLAVAGPASDLIGFKPGRVGEEPSMESLAAEVDLLYEQIRALVLEKAGNPSLRQVLRPLRARLRELQEKEADVLEAQFRAQLSFDPEEGGRVLEEANELLEEGRRTLEGSAELIEGA